MPSLLDIYGSQGQTFNQGLDGSVNLGINGPTSVQNTFRPVPTYQLNVEVGVFPYQGNNTYSPGSSVAPPDDAVYNRGHY